MRTLTRELRRTLESTVLAARDQAEAGARQALEQLAVHHHEPWGTLSPEDRTLRNRLRARGRQLGDLLDERRGGQTIGKLTAECAYEQWHRMLFARFLAECGVLVEPQSGVAISLDECKELAREQGADWLLLACSFAQRMLPQIFRSDDAVLEVSLSIEYRHGLERLLASLPDEVFLADDSLGWVYQFWQSKRKDEINASGVKIGADELSAVTQLFTEDYMVLFLLENTLGAWWAGNHLERHPDLAESAQNEEDVRLACAVPGYQWTYLRFIKGADGRWTPAAGRFDGWPGEAKDIRVLDPCMGSGHFLVFALPILAAIRMTQEGLAESTAIIAVLRDNLFGLEIDQRCTQIAAFNLALAAWRRIGFRTLPSLSLACSGLAINAHEEDWVALAGDSDFGRQGMRALYRIFQNAPTLGSLLNPHSLAADLYQAGFRELRPVLETALARESGNERTHELAVAAHGLATAAELLAERFTLVATNVPYLGSGRQDQQLKTYCETRHPAAKADLATSFAERCLAFCAEGGTAALVTPQNWLFLGTYTRLRKQFLERTEWNLAARLGPRAFETITGEVVNVALVALTRRKASDEQTFAGWDATALASRGDKVHALGSACPLQVSQQSQARNPDARIAFEAQSALGLLEQSADSYWGHGTGDGLRFVRNCWEVAIGDGRWSPLQSSVRSTCAYGGRAFAVLWENGAGTLMRVASELRAVEGHSGIRPTRGSEAWTKAGVAVTLMQDLPATLYSGEIFDANCAAVIPKDKKHLPAIWAFVSSDEFVRQVRRIDKKTNVMNQTLLKIPWDLAHWQKVADARFGHGLPLPDSNDPTQWLFNGHPNGSTAPLQVAVSRLVGYRWPRQTGSCFPDCPAVGEDGLEQHEDDDGIVCISALHGEATAADRLARLLAEAFGNDWSSGKLNELLGCVGYGGESLGRWLRDGFFEQHVTLLHQRPVVWHVWDGLRDGFAALVNYHRLAAPDGEGRRTLEKLIYTYLGDWLDRQRADQSADVQGADARVGAAQHLKRELEKILKGEPPYDIFVRWKPLHEQPIGWEPNLDDGVRINIRPFMTARPLGARGRNACVLRTTPKIKWEKDRGKEPNRSIEDFPWFWNWDEKAQDFPGGKTFDGNRWNDLHYTTAFKRGARKREGLR
jgi:hypothetical protein